MKYELTVVAPEEATGKDIIRIMSVVDKNGGTITKYTRDGVKRLAYPITLRDRRYEQGLYLYIEFEKDGYPTETSNDLNGRDEVVRYLLLRGAPEEK